MSGTTKAKRSRFLGIPFLAVGIFWILTVALREGSILLVGPGIASLLLTSLLLLGLRGVYVRSLCGAVGLYNLIILAYQAYVSSTLISLGFITYGTFGVVGYGIAALAFIFILLVTYSQPETFKTPRSES